MTAIQATSHAFAALLADGSLVTWGQEELLGLFCEQQGLAGVGVAAGDEQGDVGGGGGGCCCISSRLAGPRRPSRTWVTSHCWFCGRFDFACCCLQLLQVPFFIISEFAVAAVFLAFVSALHACTVMFYC